MTERSALKEAAKKQINGNLLQMFLCYVVIFAISLICASIPDVGPVISILLTPALTLGMAGVYLDVTKGKKASLKNLFKGFQFFGKALWLYVLISVFTMLWSFLFIIPGIVKSLSYSMAFYILAENPEMTAREALNESKKITQGHKMDLCVLEFSFLPWILFTGITFGIAGIYVMPYMACTYINFYHKIKVKSEYCRPNYEEI